MKETRPLAFSNLPIGLGALVIFVASLLLIINAAMGEFFHGKQMKLFPTLNGAVLQDNVPASLETMLNGTYQASFARRVGSDDPFYPFAIRLSNQVQYSLFNTSALPMVVVGKHHELLETAYITDYCTRDVPVFMQTAPAWAAKIRQMQNETERRGQSFLYVLSPSKVAQYPQFLPAGLRCPSSQANRLGLLPAWMALVRKDGVHEVDTTKIMWDAHGKYPFRLYPHGGTHWNSVGGALASQAVEANLESQRGDGTFTPFSFTWVMSSKPVGVDVDLALLMNLLFLPDHYDVPVVLPTQAPAPAACRPVRVVIIGGSFMHNIGDALTNLPCVSHVEEFEYWTAYDIAWTRGVETIRRGVDPAHRDAELQAADVIIYEENEQTLGRSIHGPLLYQWLSEHPMRPTAK